METGQDPFGEIKVEVKLEEEEEEDATYVEEDPLDPLALGNDMSVWKKNDREANIKCVELDVPWEEQVPQHTNIQIIERDSMHRKLPRDPLAVNNPSSTWIDSDSALRNICFSTGGTESTYVESLEQKEKEEYFSKLKLKDNSCDLPDPYKIVGWVKNPREWPDLHSGHIHQYLLCNQNAVTTKKASASLCGYNLFKSGSMRAIEYHSINSESPYCFLRTTIIMSPIVYKPWVCLDKTDGSVQISHCNCMARFKEVCSHIAALLFKVETIVSLGMHKDYSSSTKFAIWNRSYREKNQVVPVKSIDFSGPNKPKKNRRTKQLRPEPLSEAEQKEALDELKKILPNCVLFQENSDTDSASETEEERNPLMDSASYCLVKFEDAEVPVKMEVDEMGDS